LAEHAGGPFVHGVGDIVVAISALGLDGHEQFAVTDAARVVAEGRKTDWGGRPHVLATGGCDQIV
jgi:hypothetical protein